MTITEMREMLERLERTGLGALHAATRGKAGGLEPLVYEGTRTLLAAEADTFERAKEHDSVAVFG